MPRSEPEQTRLVCEIINPSDAYTIAGESFQVLAAATLLLGEGRYGLDGGDQHMPVFLFCGHEEEWCAENGLGNVSEFIKAHLAEIADALDTVMIGNIRERRAFESMIGVISDPAERERARDAWHNEKRSSLNDIGRRAWRISRSLRERAAELAGATP